MAYRLVFRFAILNPQRQSCYFIGRPLQPWLLTTHASTTTSLPHSRTGHVDSYLPKAAQKAVERRLKRFPRTSPHVGVAEADFLVRNGLAIHGELRSLSRALGYVEHPVDRTKVLVFEAHRGRALPGDMVVVRILPMAHWKVLTPDQHNPLAPSNRSDSTSSDPVLQSAEEDTLSTELSDPSSLRPPPPPEVFRVHKVFQSPRDVAHLHTSPALMDLDPQLRRLRFPHLPSGHRLFDQVRPLTPLPGFGLMRTGEVLTVLKRNPRSQHLLGQIAFYARPRFGRITRRTKPIDSEQSTDGAICLFVPTAPHHPLIKLDVHTVPKSILENRELGLATNHVCRITGWDRRSDLPFGVISDQLGDVNELEPATKQILLEFGIEEKDFTPEHLQGLPKSPKDFVIPNSEYLNRRDFRSCCVFTIDPSSAKDIDDALHIKPIEGTDLFEVGVHIADVSYFVRSGSALDREAADRTTSVYLVQRVIPMLPPILSESLCSLRPREDRLAFSVLLKVTSSGEVVDTWFGRSIVRSRAQLSYEQALLLLKTETSNRLDWTRLESRVPKPEAPFTLRHVQRALVQLNEIAINLRESRVQSGALTLQKVKIEFDLPTSLFTRVAPSEEKANEEEASSSTSSVWPRGFSVQAPGPSHRLIEEWMLAANKAVARKLFEAFIARCTGLSCTEDVGSTSDWIAAPQSLQMRESIRWPGALLRRHSRPGRREMDELVDILTASGVELTGTHSKAISTSLEQHDQKLQELGFSDDRRFTILDALSHLIYVRMRMATYYSLDDLTLSHPQLFQHSPLSMAPGERSRLGGQLFPLTWHFGLSVPLYTHFTSPIRRYADLVVHRQLASLLLPGGGSQVGSGGDSVLKAAPQWSRSTSSQLGHSLRQQPHAQASRVGRRKAMAAIASLRQAPVDSLFRLSLQAAWCNQKRMTARRAQEANQRLFLTACIQDCGPVTVDATVLSITNTGIKVLLSSYGLILNVPLKSFLNSSAAWDSSLGVNSSSSSEGSASPTKNESDKSLPKPTKLSSIRLSVSWPLSGDSGAGDEASKGSGQSGGAQQQTIAILDKVRCRVFCMSDRLVLTAELLSPTSGEETAAEGEVAQAPEQT